MKSCKNRKCKIEFDIIRNYDDEEEEEIKFTKKGF